MDMVIVIGAFNARYGNNFTCIDFSIQDTVINYIIEISGCNMITTFLISGKPLISSGTLLIRYIDILIFQERDRVEIRPCASS